MRIMEEKKITDFFGVNVFDDEKMKKYLKSETYNELREVIDQGKPLGKQLANDVAAAMKEWAITNGATHYTHWFQPLTGTTAEKHDSFLSVDKNNNKILDFTGSNLRKGEADASSFPSGGIRATFEARGYTVWDCSSPAFIKKSAVDGAQILCIPTAFCSYTGEALDKKTPLLKSMAALDREGVRLLKILGVDANKVVANVGGEQEYFLIDRKDYDKRDDLRFTGRTLFGATPPKGQEKNDQYYATIKDRVSSFMADLNEQLWKLGICAKTQHNEVAPAQHELAPIFCSCNIATDQNQLIMETMKKVAEEHGLACLLHEKPFAGVNGSGKHNNWSLSTDTGINLFRPGESPYTNYPFLLFFIATISAVDEYYDLLRMSASSLGNECRLGGHEAPPSIISVYLGNNMTALLDSIADNVTPALYQKQRLSLGVSYVADLGKDNSDRNRTSPFAFTGNKFEFRMVGSSATLSTPNMVLNSIVAEMLSRISDRLEKVEKENLPQAVYEIVREMYSQHKKVIFNGNNYSEEWITEAEKRGLKHIDNSIDAYEASVAPKNVTLFEKLNIMTKKELESRKEIYLSNYELSANIEAKTMLMMAKREILPAGLEWINKLADDLNKVKSVGGNSTVIQKLFDEANATLINLDNALSKLEESWNDTSKKATLYDKCVHFRDVVNKDMASLRKAADSLETQVSRKIWPFPTYADILFYE
jgi:glutamine synthetase